MHSIDFSKAIGGLDEDRYRDTIVTALFKLLTTYSASYRKMMVVTFDLRYPKEYCSCTTNDDISAFMRAIIQKYRRKGFSPCYFWVREHGARSQHHHYHCMMLLDANATCKYFQYLLAAEEVWGNVLNIDNPKGLVHYYTKDYEGKKQENGIILRHDDPRFEDKIVIVTRQSLYLAKEHSKGLYNDGLRDFGMSRLSSIPLLRKGTRKPPRQECQEICGT